MAGNAWETTAPPEYDGRARSPRTDDASLGELLKHLSSDTSELFRQEISLAKLEAAEAVQHLRRAVVGYAVAGVFAVTGMIAFAAFAAIALGNALDGRYWLSTLIVAAAMLLIAAVLARKAAGNVSGDRLKPQRTIESLKTNASWAAREASALKNDVTASNSTSHTRGR